jgi:hypothetical protein
MKSRVQSLLALLALAVCAGAGPEAAAQEPEAGREEELFGGEDRPAPPPAKADAASPLDEPVRTGGVISDMLQKADDPLQIGGQLSLRFQYAWADEHAPEPHLLSSPSRLYLFLDSRPNDRVRAFVRGRLDYDFTLADGADASGLPAEALGVALDQLWLKADVGRVMYLTIGRQPIRWGCGRFWNPTDFLNQQQRDPLAIFDERVGPTLVKLHFPVESINSNFYVVANLDNAKTPKDIGVAGRAEFAFEQGEVSASVAWRNGQPLKLGLDASVGVSILDLRAEAAVTYDDEKTYWRGTFDPLAGALPQGVIRDDRWSPQVTAGIEAQISYSDEDFLILGAEYFFNDMGYEDAGLYDWLLLQTASGAGGFAPFYLGRHYLAGYAALPFPGSWNNTSITLSGIGNLNDRTGILRLDWQVRVLTYLDIAVFVDARLGDRGEFHYGATVPPLAGVPGVPEAYQKGFSIPAPRLEAGVWLTLAL